MSVEHIRHEAVFTYKFVVLTQQNKHHMSLVTRLSSDLLFVCQYKKELETSTVVLHHYKEEFFRKKITNLVKEGEFIFTKYLENHAPLIEIIFAAEVLLSSGRAPFLLCTII
jgi:hypothetical protein